MKKIYILLANLCVASLAMAQQTFTTGMDAAYVIPQAGAVASAISSKGLFTAQQQANNTNIWLNVPQNDVTPLDISIAGNPVGGVAWGRNGNKLIVSENGELKIWDSIPTINNQPPDVTTPYGYGGVLVAPDGRLVVSHINNDVIYVWNQIPTTNNTPPDLTYGGLGTANNLFNRPWGMGIAPNGKFFVAEESNNRVLVFDSIPVSVSDTATMVLGQPNFTSNTQRIDNFGFRAPLGVTVTLDNKVAVCEFSNHRVMVWNQIPDTSFAPADVVLGQPDFTSNTSGTAINQMVGPYGISTDSYGRLFVSGRDMNRVMVFGEIPSDTADLVLTSTSSSSVLCSEASISFEFEVTNNGPDATTDVKILANLPFGLNVNSVTPSVGTYTVGSGLWEIPSLANGNSQTLLIIGTVDTITGPDTLEIVANIQQSFAVDTVLSNNLVTSTVYLDTVIGAEKPVVSGGGTICEGESRTLTATSSDSLTWFSSPTSQTPIGTGSTYNTGNLNSTTTYYVEAYNGCVSERVSVTVTVQNCDPDPDPNTNINTNIATDITIFPNPAKDVLNIKYEAGTITKIELINMLGRLEIVSAPKNSSEEIQLNISELNAGVYIVRINNEKNYRLIIE